MMKWIRHGDVIMEEVGEPDCVMKDVENVVLAEGEVTGHQHVLTGNLQYGEDGGQRYVTCHGEAVLQHQEHDTLNIPDGSYRVVMQREVDLIGEVRQVTD
jgi:hypothetical protein